VIAEHIAGTGGIVIDGSPVWMPDFAEQKVIDPIDSYISKAQSTLNDYHPLYRALMKYKGQTWLLRRRRRLEPLLPHGHLLQRQAQGRVQGEVQARLVSRGHGRVHGDLAVHHRPDGSEGVRRR
jgi:hypothetical protein